MLPINRREFGAFLLSATGSNLLGAIGIGETLDSAIKQRNVPAAVAMVATADRTTYTGAFGKRDSSSGIDVTPDSIFRIASMTKAITSVAALQLVERGKLNLEEPVAKQLPQLSSLQVLTGFNEQTGKPELHPAKTPVTLKQLLTHTAGFAYDNWNANLQRFLEHAGPVPPGAALPVPPLMTEPGTRWEYSTGLDWTGRLVETITGQTLEAYFQANILQPLGMTDTGFILPQEKFDRLVSGYERQTDGSLKEDPRTPPAPPKTFNGGGGLYSTAGDYVRFMQMILRRGRGTGKQQILKPETVDRMTSNRIGELSAGKMKTARPERSSDVDFHPGSTDGFGFGFLINKTAYEGGRSAGSLAWAGIQNTFYWIDPKRGVCAVLLMQFLPFCDRDAMGVLHEFERAVYANLPARS